MIRLRSIELTNFKNVEYGKVSFPSASKPQVGSDIVGVYGQNGSGKTAIIEALAVFKLLASGGSLASHSPECICLGENSAALEFELEVDEEPVPGAVIFCRVFYRVGFSCIDGVLALNSERLSYLDHASDKPRKTVLLDHRAINTESQKAVRFSSSPGKQWDAILGLDDSFSTDVAVAERLANKAQSSFVFSHELTSCLIEAAPDTKALQELSKNVCSAYDLLLFPFLRVTLMVRRFVYNLSVVTTADHAFISLNQLSLSPHRDPSIDESYPTDIRVDISRPSVLDAEELRQLDATLRAINTVLVALVPGLTLETKSLGNEMQSDGDIGTRIEVVSCRNNRTLPFRCESEGVKKIVSILGHLIDAYNDNTKCVAIDELDAGIFEFLLGEILEVLAEHGKGQLIFTAHNLRPLETLDKQSLVFTTANPKKRYVNFRGKKASHNLRDQYLRAINLGGQAETIYQSTSKYEIDSAFDEAGAFYSRNLGSKEISHGIG